MIALEVRYFVSFRNRGGTKAVVPAVLLDPSCCFIGSRLIWTAALPRTNGFPSRSYPARCEREGGKFNPNKSSKMRLGTPSLPALFGWVWGLCGGACFYSPYVAHPSSHSCPACLDCEGLVASFCFGGDEREGALVQSATFCWSWSRTLC